MRRGEECTYSLSAALTRLSSEALRCVERSRTAASRDDGIVTASFAICLSLSIWRATLRYCAHQCWFCPVLRLVDLLTNERNHVGGTLDAGEARIEDQLRNARGSLNLGLENIRLQRVKQTLVQ